MLKPSILKALQKATQVSISIDPTVIELVPHVRVKKPGGVYDNEVRPPRAPQTFLVEPVASTLSGIRGATGSLAESDGAQVHSWSYTITGTHDCEMEINDTWREGGTTYKIISLHPENGYSKIGVVAATGKDPKYGE